ncbi:MAG TPA: 2Fe-2S iron-sulfur cluster-binding protein [Symbiobacteriaceae bacterium]|nr:2Fe-2S iron-sulfur cluster-binding protein [Symbiobacteriaceae bacterium]
MPKVEVEGRGTYEVPAGTKLVLALEDNGVDILHRCGGNARCTSCRVEILEGNVPPVSEAEQAALDKKGHTPGQFRLSCQIRVTGDLKVRPAMTVATSGMEAGPRPEA